MLARALIAAAALSLVAAETCSMNKTTGVCPMEGEQCTHRQLCAAGFYCQVRLQGADGSSYTGVCAKGPKLEEVSNAGSLRRPLR
jgi:hypothetical protein